MPMFYFVAPDTVKIYTSETGVCKNFYLWILSNK
jgi:hypothetical protein